MNKKGFAPALILPFLIPLAVAILILFTGIGALFSPTLRWTVIGIAIFVAVIWLLGKSFSSGQAIPKRNLSILLVLLGVGAFFVFGSGLLNTTFFGVPSNTQLAVPHFASLRCEPIQDKVGLTYTIPSGGFLVTQQSVGFYTNSITNIKTEIQYGFWTSLVKDVRIRYQICDKYGNNCGAETIVKYLAPGTKQLSISSVDLTKNSLRVYSEQLTIANFLFGKWTFIDGTKISYDSKTFGLRTYSTTRDPAGAIVCQTSCDLTCPSQSVRSKLVYTTANTLGFYATAPYLEYWESINYDLNSQYGGSIYNSVDNKFCLAGALYSAKTLKLQETTYVYPDTATRQTVQCCSGAVISSTYEDKICQSDYTWKTISKDTRIKCISDLQCPGQGLDTCQNKLKSGWSCSGYESSIGKFCQKDAESPVQCCSASDCSADMVCQSNKCVGGNVLPIEEPQPGEDETTECKSYEKSVVKDTEVYSKWWQLGGLVPIGSPDKVSTTECKTAEWVYAVIGGIVAIALGGMYFGMDNKPKGRKK